METENEKKKRTEYLCECCNFSTYVKRDYNNHMYTKKHQDKQNKNSDNDESFVCNICNKEYKNRSGLWKHYKDGKDGKKKCKPLKENKKEANDDLKNKINNDNPVRSINYDLVTELLKQNNELQKQIIELAKEPRVVNNYQQNNNNNTTNNQFNLNMFLNEDCKNALNIDDFMDSLQLTVEDLEQTGELGFVQGITRIFLKGLKELEVTQRPIHCTDTKRETMYIKDQDKWNKETTDKKLMGQAVKNVENKNLKMIHVWREDHPDYLRSNTKDNDEYIKIFKSSLGSVDDEGKRMYEKIIRNVLKEVFIDRKSMNQIEEEV